MRSIHRARWENAQRFGNKVQTLLNNGYLVFDSDGELVKKIIVDDSGVYQGLDSGCKAIIFLNDTDLDNGMYTTIKDFNDEYSTWTAVEITSKNNIKW